VKSLNSQPLSCCNFNPLIFSLITLLYLVIGGPTTFILFRVAAYKVASAKYAGPSPGLPVMIANSMKFKCFIKDAQAGGNALSGAHVLQKPGYNVLSDKSG
jgi:hypothetical protein